MLTQRVLDIFDKTSGIKHGERYAEWLEFARFSGPVVITSQYSISVKPYCFLPNVLTAARITQDDWAKQSSDFLIKSFRVLDRVREYEPIVIARGRQPINRLQYFYNLYNLPKWRSGWVGKNDDGLKSYLEVFFSLTPHPNRHFSTLTQTQLDNIATWDQVNVVFIDCGKYTDVINELVDQVHNMLDKCANNEFYPLVFLLSDRFEQLDDQRKDKLFKHCVSTLPRSSIKENIEIWAEQAIHYFSAAYRGWRTFEKSWASLKTSEAAELESIRIFKARQVIEAFWPVYLMARSVQRISGEADGSPITGMCQQL